ncbi:leukocyte receptor cluster member 1 [Caerostris extrusa]|uniref:Leukocyte receptor cluster member 1 n=1 Tax=Caerostris extrusa TaxID=172846 RepID=A0AAV4Y0P3_CAEEX|nr:leukocyte receptor cluster member 1 [Caerostris extrusa]
MNILPKKGGWHVRTKQNIERVRRDEAKAAEEEKELKRRIQLAEQEARTELLRKKAKGESVKNDSLNAKEHLNFFKDIEDSGGFWWKNKEHEEEEKDIKEKFEKNIGLLTYLGQSSLETKGEVPWYLKGNLKEISTTSEETNEVASAKHKSKIDPLNDMEKYLTIRKTKYGDKEFYIDKKEKKTHKNESKKLSKIEELRAKRLKRENEEKKRTQQFLESFRKGPSQPEPVVLDDRMRQYNSQFNPHLARNNLFTKNYEY